MPVYADRGRTGGYRLVGGYRTRLTGLARGEAEALFLSGVPGALREMGLEDAASAARLKVSAALLPLLRDAPRLRRPAFPPRRPGLVPGPGDTRTAAGHRGGRVGRPAAVRPVPAPGHRGPARARRRTGSYSRPVSGTLRAAARRTFRVYRVDRFSSVEPLEGHFARDEAFDLPGFWEERAAAVRALDPRTEVVLRLSPAGRPAAARTSWTAPRRGRGARRRPGRRTGRAGSPSPCRWSPRRWRTASSSPSARRRKCWSRRSAARPVRRRGGPQPAALRRPPGPGRSQKRSSARCGRPHRRQPVPGSRSPHRIARRCVLAAVTTSEMYAQAFGQLPSASVRPYSLANRQLDSDVPFHRPLVRVRGECRHPAHEDRRLGDREGGFLGDPSRQLSSARRRCRASARNGGNQG